VKTVGQLLDDVQKRFDAGRRMDRRRALP